jgi:hypothetical protein
MMVVIQEEIIAELKEALRAAILTVNRVTRKTIDVDPAGNTYGIDWSDDVRHWASLCDLDLTNCDPCFYDR